MQDTRELPQVLAQAEDIAATVGQDLTTAHLLLAFFATPCAAGELLRERGIGDREVLACLTRPPREPPGRVEELVTRAREIAAGLGAPCDSLHLLIACTRLRDTLACELLARTGLPLAALRNTIISWYTGSRRPRKMEPRGGPARLPPARPRELADDEILPGVKARPLRQRSGGAAPSRGRGSVPLAREAGAASAPSAATPPLGVGAASASPPPPPLARHRPDAPEARPTPPAPERPASDRAAAEAGSPPARPPEPTPFRLAPSAGQPAAPQPAPSGRTSPIQPAQRPGEPIPVAPERVRLDPALFPQLCAFGRNLSLLAAEGKLDPVIGRDREIEEVVDILGKRRGNNPVLVGAPGVGKTAVVEGVAQALLAATRPDEPARVVVELDIGSLVAGTSLRGAFSERLGAIKEEVRSAGGRIVVFLDEIHTLVGAGSTGDGPQDAANELKTALARGEFPCIGATTFDEYRKHIGSDPALERRFTPVPVEEPSVEATVEILRGLAPRYEAHHRIRYEPAALEAAARLSARYVRERQLPDKAIGILDLAGSRARRAGREAVDVRAVAEVVARIASIPLDRLLLDDRERLLRLEEELARRVVGHEETIRKVAAAIRRNYAGFAARRPMGSFLFLGPTGVGKTELAKAIAEVLHGTDRALVRVDMSELSEAHTVSRLVGAPPGYVGHGDGGQLTEAVRRRPASVVLFDEIEKAHREVLLLLLQILDEGRLTDAQGRAVDFTQTIVILTSNLGAEAFTERSAPRLGFGAAAGAERARSERALEIARSSLPPELWNRIDERCLFEPLSREQVAAIARLLLAASARRLLEERRIVLRFDDAVIDRLLERGGWDPALGARPMRQAIQREVEAPLAEAILRGEIPDGVEIVARVEDGSLRFRR